MFFSICCRLLCCARQYGGRSGHDHVPDAVADAWTYAWTYADATAGPDDAVADGWPDSRLDRSPDETNHRSRQEVLARV